MALPSTSATFKTGYRGSVTINGNTYTNAEEITLPSLKYSTVKTQHLGGLDVIPEGISDYGQLVFTIPEDGGAAYARQFEADGKTPKKFAVSVTIAQLSVTISGNGYVIDEGGASMKRGSSLGRKITVEMTDWIYAAS